MCALLESLFICGASVQRLLTQMEDEEIKEDIYCGIIIFRGGSIFVVFVDTINHEFTSPTNNDV